MAKMIDPSDATKTINDPTKRQDSQSNYGLRVSYNHPDGYYFTGTYEYVDLDQEEPISA